MADLTDEQREQIIETLEACINGLQFYRDLCPDNVDGSDYETDERISDALHIVRGTAHGDGDDSSDPHQEAILAGWRAAIRCHGERGAAGWSAYRAEYLRDAAAGLSRTEGEPTPPRGNDGGEHA